MRQKLKQFIGFGLVGGVNTILTYLIYLTLYQLINPTAAMGVGYGLTSIFGLFLNDTWVFKAKDRRQLKTVAPRYYHCPTELPFKQVLGISRKGSCCT